jgi:WD40 repeat protein
MSKIKRLLSGLTLNLVTVGLIFSGCGSNPAPTAMVVLTPTTAPSPEMTTAPTQVSKEWPLTTDNLEKLVLQNVLRHGREIRSVQFSPDSKYLVTVEYDFGPTIQVWDLESKKMVLGRDMAETAENTAFSADGSQLVFTDGNKIIFMDMITGEETEISSEDSVSTFTLSRDGKWLAAAYDSFPERTWLMNLETGEKTKFDFLDDNRVSSLVFSPDDTSVYYGAENLVGYWDLNGGKDHTLEIPGVSMMTDIHLNTSGSLLAVSDSYDLILWDLPGGKVISELEGAKPAAFYPDGALLASQVSENILGIWDLQTGQLKASLNNNTRLIHTIAFSPDGSMLASGSDDGIVYVWGISGKNLDLPSVTVLNLESGCQLDKGISRAWLETLTEPATFQVEFTSYNSTVETCRYSEGHTYEVQGCNVTAAVKDIQTQEILDTRRFPADESTWSSCPDERYFSEKTESTMIYPARQDFTDWLEQVLITPEAVSSEAAPVPPEPTGAPMPCLLYTSPSPRDGLLSRMPSSA